MIYIYIYVIAYIKYTSVFAQFLTNRVCHLPWLKWMEPMVGPNSWGSELPGMASSLYQVPARKADVNEASCTVTVLAVYNCGTSLRHCYISLYIGIYTVYRCIYIYTHPQTGYCIGQTDDKPPDCGVPSRPPKWLFPRESRWRDGWVFQLSAYIVTQSAVRETLGHCGTLTWFNWSFPVPPSMKSRQRRKFGHCQYETMKPTKDLALLWKQRCRWAAGHKRLLPTYIAYSRRRLVFF